MAHTVDILKYVLGLDTRDLQKNARVADMTVDRMATGITKTLMGLSTVFAGVFALHKVKAFTEGLGNFATQMTLVAARTEELQVVLNNVGRVSGYSADHLARQEEIIKNLGITTQTARIMLIRFMQAELDIADASKIARAAQNLGVIADMNTAQAAETMTQAIAAQRPILLKRFGILTNLNDIYGKMAKSINKSVDDLTELERRQSFVNAILEQAARVTGTYTAAMETAGKRLKSIPRYAQEAANAVGTIFLPVFRKMIDDVTQGFKDIEKALKENQEAVKEWQAIIVAAYKPVTWMMLSAKLGIKTFINGLRLLKFGILDLPWNLIEKLTGFTLPWQREVFGPPKPPPPVEIPPPDTDAVKKALDELYAYHSEITEGMAEHTMFMGDYVLKKKQEQYAEELRLEQEKWAKIIAEQEEVLDLLLVGYDSFFNSLIERNLSVTEALNLAWQDLTRSMLGYGADVVKQEIKNALLRKTIEQDVQKTKLASVASGAAKSIAWMAKEGAAAVASAAKFIYEAVAKIFKAHAGIPFVGVAIAGGFIAAMMATLGKFKKFAEGGLVGGDTSTVDKIAAFLTKGEYVMPRRAVQAIGVPTLDYMRRTRSAPGPMTVNVDMGGFSFGQMDRRDAFIIETSFADTVVDAMKEAIRQGKLEI